jgi:hypothetical protein
LAVSRIAPMTQAQFNGGALVLYLLPQGAIEFTK